MTRQVTTTDVYGNEHQIDVSLLKWRPSAYGIVIKDNKILMSPQFDDKYDLPGGGIDINEKIEDAVVREVKEETGLSVTIVKLIEVKQNFFSSTHDKAGAKHYNSILFYYLCKYESGEISTDNFDEEEIHYAKAAQWIPLEKLDSLKLASTVDFRPIIKQAQKDQA